MISAEYVQKLIEKFADSKAGKAEVKKQCGIGYDSKKDDVKIAREYAYKMREVLWRHVRSVIKSISKEDILIGSPVFNKDGTGLISLSFNNDALFRPSLQPQGKIKRDGSRVGWACNNVGQDADGNYGINNIVLHFSYGWNAHGAISGRWHDKNDVWSRKTYGGHSFLEDAVDEFNSKVKKFAKAELVGEYAKL